MVHTSFGITKADMMVFVQDNDQNMENRENVLSGSDLPEFHAQLRKMWLMKMKSIS
jgi:hypothetical protein